MAHVKAQGNVKNGRDSVGRRLGLKLAGGQRASAGMIILRQRGTKFLAGEGTYLGKDQTIHAGRDGVVTFRSIPKRGFDGSTESRTEAMILA